MILIIDYDMGNIGSIKNMLHKIGCNDVIISNNPERIQEADKLILPGVGAFDRGVKNLKELGIFDEIKEVSLNNKKPIMGICLGMQLLGRKSEEGLLEGLNLIPFDSVRFRLSDEYKVPHMGWNDVIVCKKDAIIDESMINQRFYFVHSYHAVCDNQQDILMKCQYGYEFAAAVSKDNVYGFQFHPEKSHRFGMELFRKFVEI